MEVKRIQIMQRIRFRSRPRSHSPGLLAGKDAPFLGFPHGRKIQNLLIA
jgi:hypothetical protein